MVHNKQLSKIVNFILIFNANCINATTFLFNVVGDITIVCEKVTRILELRSVLRLKVKINCIC